MISSLAICSDSNPRYDLAPPPDTEQVWVTGDIGDTVLVTGTSDGEVIVRNKVTYGAFYRAAHHGDTPIMALKVAPWPLVQSSSNKSIYPGGARRRAGGDLLQI